MHLIVWHFHRLPILNISHHQNTLRFWTVVSISSLVGAVSSLISSLQQSGQQSGRRAVVTSAAIPFIGVTVGDARTSVLSVPRAAATILPAAVRGVANTSEWTCTWDEPGLGGDWQWDELGLEGWARTWGRLDLGRARTGGRLDLGRARTGGCNFQLHTPAIFPNTRPRCP